MMRSRLATLAACVLVAIIASAPRSNALQGTAADGPLATRDGQRAATPLTDRRATLERWTEALDLDLPGEVIEPGIASVTDHGAFARDGEAIALVARALALVGDSGRAREIIDGAAVDAAGQGWLALARARLALDDDDLARAIATLAAPGSTGARDGDFAARVRYPAIAQGWLVLGRALARSGAAREAEIALARFVDMAPLDVDVPAAWHMRAQGALARGDIETAERFRARGEQCGQWQAYYRTRRLQIRENPREPLPRLGLAQLWLAVDEPLRAEQTLDELLRLAPDFCRAFDLLGETHRKRGDAISARSAYDRALACDPKLDSALFNRGLLAASEGRLEDARADLARLVDGPASTDKRFVRAHLELARALDRLGDASGAARRFERYRELGGSDPLR